MPVDRTLADDLARKLVDIYAELEADIVADLARRITAGLDIPEQASEKLGAINDLRNAVQRMINRTAVASTAAAAQQVILAFARGGKAALEEIAAAGGLTEAQLAAIRLALPGAEAINSLAWSLVSTLNGTHVRILRWSEDVYRDVVASVLPHALSGKTTRLGIAQRALDRFVSRGVTGFQDKSGRNWQLTSYVEMATRTGLAHAAVQGHFDRLTAAGIELVQVSDSPQECVLCRPWEGKILSVNGRVPAGLVTMQHATDDALQVTFAVSGSVTEAIAKGLMHPNCRHSFGAFLPGVTKRHANTQDPEGDKARQKQRAIERAIRRAKTMRAAAMTPGAKHAADQDIRRHQAAMRAHMAANPTFRRLSRREQIGAAR